MEEWEQPHWSGKPQLKVETRPRLKPNLFDRIARSSARNPPMVFVSLLFLCAFAVSFAALRLDIDPTAPPQIMLDVQTAAAQANLDRNFPGIDETFVASVESEDAAAARRTVVDVAAVLAKRTDLFSYAFVPGTGEFYAKYGILFRDGADVSAKVALALQMQPLYHALAQAPDVAGLAALISGISRAAAQGRSPPGLTDVLQVAAAAVEGEINGSAKPVGWPQLAGFPASVDSTKWFVIAVPTAGSEREAAAFATTAAQKLSGLSWYFPPGANAVSENAVRDLIVPAILALLVSLTILGMGLGAAKFVVPVVLTTIATLSLTAGIAALLAPGLDAVSWSFASTCIAPALLFSIVLVLAHIQARVRGSEPMTALMLAAHRRGALLVALAILAEIFWLTWVVRQLPSLALTATIAAAGIALAMATALTIVPAALAAFDKGGTVGVHWLDAEVAQPLDHNVRNARQLFVLLLVAASVFCSVFVPGLRLGDAARQPAPNAALDTPVARDAVHLIVKPGDEARRMVEAVAKLPETGAIRTVEQFLPAGVERKLQDLHQLDGLLPGVPALRGPTDPAAIATAFQTIQSDLRQIAGEPTTAADLGAAATRLRRAIELYTNPQLPGLGSVAALQDALFSGLGELSNTTNQLAKLDAPTIDRLDVDLKRRFVSGTGQWRIEALPKPDVSNLKFAAGMRKISMAAAGEPILALARTEIIHHETALAVSIALALAAIAILLLLRSLWDWVLAIFPALFAMTLISAVTAATGLVLTPSALAAAMTAIAACLSSSVILVLRGRAQPSVSDTSLRAALLPPLVLLGTAAPLAISTNPTVADFGLISTLFLGVGIFVSLMVVPQGRAWMARWRSGKSGQSL